MKPKEFGGIGVKDLGSMNEAFLAKMLWRLLSREQGMWTDVLKNRYNKGASFNFEVLRGSNCSHLWGDLVGIWNKVRDYCSWDVGDG